MKRRVEECTRDLSRDNYIAYSMLAAKVPGDGLEIQFFAKASLIVE